MMKNIITCDKRWMWKMKTDSFILHNRVKDDSFMSVIKEICFVWMLREVFHFLVQKDSKWRKWVTNLSLTCSHL